MTMKDLIWGKSVRKYIIGTGLIITTLIGSKLLYDYSIYSNLKYIKKQLKDINYDNSRIT